MLSFNFHEMQEENLDVLYMENLLGPTITKEES